VTLVQGNMQCTFLPGELFSYTNWLFPSQQSVNCTTGNDTSTLDVQVELMKHCLH
jgi:hypothetical protein